MLKVLAIYRQAIAGGGGSLLGLMVLSGVASLLEGSALILLVPIIELGSGNVPNQGGVAVEFLTGVLSSVGVPRTVTMLAVAFGVLSVASAILTWLTNVTIHYFITATDARMRRVLFERVIGLNWPRLAGEDAGIIIKALNSDPIQAGLGLHNLLIAGTAAVAGLAYLAIALMLSWSLTLLALGFVLVVYPVYFLLVRWGRQASRQASASETKVITRGAEFVASAQFIFSQGLRRFAADAYSDSVEGLRWAKFKQDGLAESSRLVFELVALIFVAALLAYIAQSADLPISMGLVFLAVFYRLAPKIVTVQGGIFRAINHASWIENWARRVADYGAHGVPAGGQKAPKFAQSLVIKGGTYSYPPRNAADGGASAGQRAGIRGVDFELRRGEAVAVTGPSGHGKSTLIDVVTGLITLDSGAITMDGVSFADIDIAAWQRRIGLVLQEAPLSYGTIQENILFGGDTDIDQARFDQAVKIALVDEFAATLPGAYETMVGERGYQLSGGQRQRVALARAFYRNPDLLILDEATSALDPDTAARMIANIRGHALDMAILLVSHEPTLLSLAMRVYEMRDGALRPLEKAQT